VEAVVEVTLELVRILNEGAPEMDAVKDSVVVGGVDPETVALDAEEGEVEAIALPVTEAEAAVVALDDPEKEGLPEADLLARALQLAETVGVPETEWTVISLGRGDSVPEMELTVLRDALRVGLADALRDSLEDPEALGLPESVLDSLGEADALTLPEERPELDDEGLT
jgi:hypothetical protein